MVDSAKTGLWPCRCGMTQAALSGCGSCACAATDACTQVVALLYSGNDVQQFCEASYRQNLHPTLTKRLNEAMQIHGKLSTAMCTEPGYQTAECKVMEGNVGEGVHMMSPFHA